MWSRYRLVAGGAKLGPLQFFSAPQDDLPWGGLYGALAAWSAICREPYSGPGGAVAGGRTGCRGWTRRRCWGPPTAAAMTVAGKEW